jgi:integrase
MSRSRVSVRYRALESGGLKEVAGGPHDKVGAAEASQGRRSFGSGRCGGNPLWWRANDAQACSPRRGWHVKSYLEPDEVESLAQAATNERDRLLIILLHHLACRINEALGTAVEDIDFASCTITIQHLKGC